MNLEQALDHSRDTTGAQDFILDTLTGPLRDGVHLRAVAAARKVVEEAETMLLEAIRTSVGAGDSWTMIGLALHTSKQNAHRKYAPLLGEQADAEQRSIKGGTDISATADQMIGSLQGLINMYRITNRGEEVNMTNDNSRHVVPGKDGGWDVVKPGSTRSSSHHDTQADAIDRGRDIVRNAGGGELNIHRRDGQIRAKDTIAPGNDPRNIKG
ncbi:DUF2188 domain-containing protein [Microbacterium sp. 179-I 1D1 NHS]|uniref:DUF2188 domain-containing protein n=1 Tax=Microbacterium sp. 179-I 1D1 NHS TaxID=3374298 RepID=UPI00387A1E30